MYYGYNPNRMLYNPNSVAQITPSTPFPSMPQIPRGPGGVYPVSPPVPGSYQVPVRRTPMDMYPVPEIDFQTPGRASPTQESGAPTSPPPQYTPQKTQPSGGFAYMVDPFIMRPCRFRHTYIWLNDGNEFWYYPTAVGANSVGGYFWNGTMWVYYGLDLNRVDSVSCP